MQSARAASAPSDFQACPPLRDRVRPELHHSCPARPAPRRVPTGHSRRPVCSPNKPPTPSRLLQSFSAQSELEPARYALAPLLRPLGSTTTPLETPIPHLPGAQPSAARLQAMSEWPDLCHPAFSLLRTDRLPNPISHSFREPCPGAISPAHFRAIAPPLFAEAQPPRRDRSSAASVPGSDTPQPSWDRAKSLFRIPS